MSYILDSLTNKDRKRREERPIATLLPQGNRALKRNNKALILSVGSAITIGLLFFVLIWLLWNRAPSNAEQMKALTDELIPDDDLIRQLELVSSLQNDGNISVDSSASLIDNAPIVNEDSPRPQFVTDFSATIDTARVPSSESQTKKQLANKNESIKEPSNVSQKNEQAATPSKPKSAVSAIEKPQVDSSIKAHSEQSPKSAAQAQPSSSEVQSSKGQTESTGAATSNRDNQAISKTYPVDFKAPDITALSYSHDPKKRFVMLDGVIYKEGDITLDDIDVVEIQRNRIVLKKNGQSFYYQ